MPNIKEWAIRVQILILMQKSTFFGYYRDRN